MAVWLTTTLRGPRRHAVHEGIEFEAVEEQAQIPALHKHNALLHSSFTWDDEAEDVK